MTDATEVVLCRRWLKLAAASCWDDQASQRCVDLLVVRYGEAGRAYHNQQHLLDCLAELDGVRDLCQDAAAVETALWFHDAVYDPRCSDNEAESADLAADQLAQLGGSGELTRRVRGLVLDTAHRAEPEGPDGELIVDIDLAILGKNPERFDNYDAAIRSEYAHVPDELFRQGRADVLRRFLGRPNIYHTRAFQERYERAARANLTRAIAGLGPL